MDCVSVNAGNHKGALASVGFIYAGVVPPSGSLPRSRHLICGLEPYKSAVPKLTPYFTPSMP